MQSKKMFTLKRFAAAAIMSLCGAGAAFGQAFPNRPLNFTYPYAAGGGPDVMWRTVVAEASKQIGQPIVFENRVGAGGRIGLDYVLRSKPDGYSIVAAPNALIVVQALADPQLYVEPGKHYVPIVPTIETYLVLTVRSGGPFKDVKGMIEYARANKGKFNAGTPGAGTVGHLGIAMLGTKAGIDMTTIHYKGLAPATTAMLGGEIDVVLADLTVKPHIDSGKLMAIASSGSQRWGVFPNVPTMQEAGVAGFDASSWHCVAGPVGLAPDVVNTINRAFNEALKNQEVRSKLEAAGWAVKGGTAAEATAAIRAQLELYRPVVKAANIQLN